MDELLGVHKRLLTFAADRTDIKKALKQSRSGRAESTIRVAAWAAAALITIAVSAYGVNNWMIHREAESKLAEATALFHDGQHDAARTMVQGMLLERPYIWLISVLRVET